MAKKRAQDEEVILDVDQTIDKAEVFFQENKNYIFGIIGTIVGAIFIWFAYTKWYQAPREANAQDALFVAQKHFQNDSLNLALNGNGSDEGFLDIMANFSGTKAANLSRYYAGISYLNLNDYENAIKFLDKFKAPDQVLGIIRLGAIGDAFLELGQPDEALDYYERAARTNPNTAVSPYYLRKAADTAMIIGKYDRALKHYEHLKKEFKNSREALEIDKYIAWAETKKVAQ
jgi:tetratricopeptide (TPR) repeat protein